LKSDPQTSSKEVLAGLVERVTFHNEENGFCVLRTRARGHRDLVTVIGQAAAISAGEWITASGEWANNRTHWQQFRARFLKTVGRGHREVPRLGDDPRRAPHHRRHRPIAVGRARSGAGGHHRLRSYPRYAAHRGFSSGGRESSESTALKRGDSSRRERKARMINAGTSEKR
jgi:hypothetical protein